MKPCFGGHSVGLGHTLAELVMAPRGALVLWVAVRTYALRRLQCMLDLGQTLSALVIMVP